MIRKRWRIELSKYQALAKKRDFWRRLAVKALVLDLCLVAVVGIMTWQENKDQAEIQAQRAQIAKLAKQERHWEAREAYWRHAAKASANLAWECEKAKADRDIKR